MPLRRMWMPRSRSPLTYPRGRTPRTRVTARHPPGPLPVAAMAPTAAYGPAVPAVPRCAWRAARPRSRGARGSAVAVVWRSPPSSSGWGSARSVARPPAGRPPTTDGAGRIADGTALRPRRYRRSTPTATATSARPVGAVARRPAASCRGGQLPGGSRGATRRRTAAAQAPAARRRYRNRRQRHLAGHLTAPARARPDRCQVEGGAPYSLDDRHHGSGGVAGWVPPLRDRGGR